MEVSSHSVYDPEEEDRLQKLRRSLELSLIQELDRCELKPGECWYLMDSDWLNKWSSYVNEDGNPPGPVSSKSLVDSRGNPLPNLKARIDYRGVLPIVYFSFVDLHGSDSSPLLYRSEIDIYSRPVPVESIIDVQYAARQDSRIAVHNIRQQWMKIIIQDEDDDELVNNQPLCTCCCCGYPITFLALRKEHIEAFIYWMVMCWSRKKSGRGNIKYHQYTPLATSSSHGMDRDSSSHGSISSLSGHGVFEIGLAEKDASSSVLSRWWNGY